MKVFINIFIILIFVVGCNETQVNLRTFPLVESANPLNISLDCNPMKIGYKDCRISASLPLKIGNLYNNNTKTAYTNEIMLTVEQIPFINEMVEKRFYDILKDNGYLLTGSPDNLFNEFSNDKPDLIVGSRIVEIGENAILSYDSFWGLYTVLEIQSYVKINWQVFSVSQREVVFETTTEGYVATPRFSKFYSFAGKLIVEPETFHGAISQAIVNFARDQKFFEKVCFSSANNEDKAKTTEEVSISKIIGNEKPLTNQISQVRSAVVTVASSGGHGSGFCISEDGYILTNSHVVGENLIVRVKLSTGRELLADVLKSDSVRDVALLKTERGGMDCLPMNLNGFNIGDEVYAVGSPLDEKLSTTLSKGIISAFRKINGLEFIQSDVNVLPGNSGGPLLDSNGNVVGMCVSGVGEGLDINFFIPIREAIDVLDIKFR